MLFNRATCHLTFRTLFDNYSITCMPSDQVTCYHAQKVECCMALEVQANFQLSIRDTIWYLPYVLRAFKSNSLLSMLNPSIHVFMWRNYIWNLSSSKIRRLHNFGGLSNHPNIKRVIGYVYPPIARIDKYDPNSTITIPIWIQCPWNLAIVTL